uniref:Secreted protein n=1 Tax=Equus caballus TaxID=9796 RepID=A0A9L0RF12_HORSE
MKSHLFILSIVSIVCGDMVSKKIHLILMSKSVWPTFSSRRLMVSGLTFRSLIPLEFVFVNGEKEWSVFILSHVAFQFSQHHLLKRLSFLHCMPSAPLSKISCP